MIGLMPGAAGPPGARGGRADDRLRLVGAAGVYRHGRLPERFDLLHERFDLIRAVEQTELGVQMEMHEG